MMDIHNRKFSRQTFLRLLTRVSLGLAGGLGLAGLIRYFSHSPGSSQTRTYDLGPAGEFPPDGKLIRLDIPAVIYWTGEGYRAYSLVCTHLGCVLEENGTGFSCPCHGSSFSAEGKVTGGPASADLPRMKVELTPEGNLLLHQEGEG